MDILLSTLHLSWLGGATTYLLTVAPVLQRLGHDVTLYSPDAGATARLAAERGLRLATTERDLPERPDAIVVQDPVMALELAGRYDTPQVFVSHGAELDMAAPSPLPGITAAIVVMNERAAARARSLALDTEVVRLRQPIDEGHFCDRGSPRQKPAQVLLLGNYLTGQTRSVVTGACEDLGLRWTQVGRHGTVTSDPASAIAAADIVVGYGRSIIEGMASSRAAYVFDHRGSDGWVTEATYAALERDGFAGTAFARAPDRGRVRDELAQYEAHMGVVNRDLVISHHRALEHGCELSELLMRVAGGTRTPITEAREMARLMRANWESTWQAYQLRRELRTLHQRLRELEPLAARTEDAERALRGLVGTRRWRFVQRTLAPLDSLRKR
jgi:hypothetical protein